MTIDEAIEFSKYKSNQQNNELEGYEYDAEEHEKIVKWLEELNLLRLQNHLGRDEAFNSGYQQGREDAINEMKKILNSRHAAIHFSEQTDWHTITMFNKDSNWLAEQMKGDK